MCHADNEKKEKRKKLKKLNCSMRKASEDCEKKKTSTWKY